MTGDVILLRLVMLLVDVGSGGAGYWAGTMNRFKDMMEEMWQGYGGKWREKMSGTNGGGRKG